MIFVLAEGKQVSQSLAIDSGFMQIPRVRVRLRFGDEDYFTRSLEYIKDAARDLLVHGSPQLFTIASVTRQSVHPNHGDPFYPTGLTHDTDLLISCTDLASSLISFPRACHFIGADPYIETPLMREYCLLQEGLRKFVCGTYRSTVCRYEFSFLSFI